MARLIRRNIPAKSHPAHYLMHRYWGRKPHNIINQYIKNFSKDGDTILDPFMGSGVVIIESLKLNRKAIGIDLNPLSCFIAKNTIENIDIDKFEKTFNKIYEKNHSKFINLYQTKCPKCNKKIHFQNSIWKKEELILLRSECNTCGKVISKSSIFDKKSIDKSARILKKEKKNGNIIYPQDKILDYVKRSNKTHIDQLFTPRALLILSSIRRDIENIKDQKIKNLMLLSFSSMLPNVSKMIPGDEKTVNGKSGWVVSKLWAPEIHTEKNIFISFKTRFKKIKKAKIETNKLIKINNSKIINKSSEAMRAIKSNSIDYIFTDPPYGESIAYFGLSMFFNSWIKNKVNYKDEIIYDPYRNKKYDDYENRLRKVFTELYRVLKKGAYLSFSFHNRNLKIWKIVIDSVKDAGFELRNIVYQDQAVLSGTQGLNRKNTLKGDFIYNFQKIEKKKKSKIKKIINSEKFIINKVEKLIMKNDGYLTSDKLYEILIPEIVKKNLYKDYQGKVINIENILLKNFKYKKIKSTKNIYGWKKK